MAGICSAHQGYEPSCRNCNVKLHRLQHPTAPTWCIDCGRFDCYIRGPLEECPRPETGEFDSRNPANVRRVIKSMVAGDHETPGAGGSKQLDFV